MSIGEDRTGQDRDRNSQENLDRESDRMWSARSGLVRSDPKRQNGRFVPRTETEIREKKPRLVVLRFGHFSVGLGRSG